MTRRKDDGIRSPLLSVRRSDALYAAALDNQVGHPTREVDLASHLQDGLSHVPDDDGQTVRPDMRMSLIENLILCTMQVKEVQDSTDIPFLMRTGIEFPVREGAGTAFAEAVVALWVQTLVAVKGSDVFLSFGDRFATLYDNGLVSQFNEPQGSEETGRARSDHYYSWLSRYVTVGEQALFRWEGFGSLINI